MEERKESKLKRFLKKSSTKDRIGLLALVWILGSLVFITIVDYALDPDTFTDTVKRNAWLTKTLLMMGLIIYGLFYAESVATDLVKKNPDGLYQKNLEKFLSAR